MKKQLPLIIVLLFALGSTTFSATNYCGNSGPSVCTPGSYSVAGFQTPYDNFPCVVKNVPYQQAVGFKVPQTVFGFTVISVVIDSIANLPCGLCWATNKATNSFLANENLCLSFSGTTGDLAGAYELDIRVTANISGIGNFSTNLNAVGFPYFLRVKTAAAPCDIVANLQYITACGPPIWLYSNIYPGSICIGDSTHLSAGINDTTDVTFSWTGPGGFNSTDVNPVVYNASQGWYYLHATHHPDNFVAADSVYLTVNAPSVPTVSVSPASSFVCPGDTLTFTPYSNPYINIQSIHWFVNGVPKPSGLYSFTYSQWSGNDAISCVIDSGTGCITGLPVTSSPAYVSLNAANPYTFRNLGNIPNLLNNLEDGTNQLLYEPATKTLAYVHRQSAAFGNGGNLRFDYSTDTGASWQLNKGVINPAVPGNNHFARHPQGVFHNPTGNTNSASQTLCYTSATTDGTNYDGYNTGSSKLNLTGITETYTTLGINPYTNVPHGLSKAANDNYFMVEAPYDISSQRYKGLRVFQGQFSAGAINWAAGTILSTPFDSLMYGKPVLSDYDMAFDSSGMNGWVVAITHIFPSTKYIHHAVFYHSTDGGLTWGSPIIAPLDSVRQHTIGNTTGVFVSNSNPNQHDVVDLTVDYAGNPHAFLRLADVDSFFGYYPGFSTYNQLYDLTIKNGAWKADLVDATPIAEMMFNNGTVQSDRPQVSMSPDRKNIVYAYLKDAFNTYSKDLYVKARNVVTGYTTAEKNLTVCSPYSGQVAFPKMAPVLITGNDNYKVPIMFNSPYSFNDELDSAASVYIDNVRFLFCELDTTGKPHVNVTPSGNQNICTGHSVLLSVPNVAGATYQWYKDGLPVAGANARQYDAAQSGVYKVRLSSNCYDLYAADSAVINVNTNVLNSFSAPSTVCKGDSIHLEVTGTFAGTPSFKWYKGATLKGTTSVQWFKSSNSAAIGDSGTYYVKVINSCDTLTSQSIHVDVIAPKTATISATICQGNSYFFNGVNLSAAGTYKDTLTATTTGCDSILTLNLSLVSSFSSTFNESICNGDSYFYNNQNITSAGNYKDTIPSSGGCDSIVTLHLTLIPITTTNIAQSICQGSSYSFFSQNLTTAGVYRDTLSAITGCDSIIRLTLSVTAPPVTNIAQSFCQGSSYFFNSQTITSAGIYNDTLSTGAGCDSIVRLTLSMTTPPVNNIAQSICQGSSYFFNSQNITTAGIYNDTLSTGAGCDSIVRLTLSITAPPVNNIAQSICQGSSYFFNSQNITSAGIYNDTLSTGAGCDSIVRLTLSVTAPPITNLVESICPGDEFVFNGQSLSSGGIYFDTLSTGAGCDSILKLTLSLFTMPSTPVITQHGDTLESTSGTDYEWYLDGSLISTATGKKYIPTATGNYQVIVTSADGCISDTSNAFHFIVSGVTEVNNHSISVYPNPANGGEVYINIVGLSENAQMLITNILGQSVLKKQMIKNGINAIDISSLIDGVYLLLIKDESIEKITKLVIHR